MKFIIVHSVRTIPRGKWVRSIIYRERGQWIHSSVRASSTLKSGQKPIHLCCCWVQPTLEPIFWAGQFGLCGTIALLKPLLLAGSAHDEVVTHCQSHHCSNGLKVLAGFLCSVRFSSQLFRSPGWRPPSFLLHPLLLLLLKTSTHYSRSKIVKRKIFKLKKRANNQIK